MTARAYVPQELQHRAGLSTAQIAAVPTGAGPRIATLKLPVSSLVKSTEETLAELKVTHVAMEATGIYW